MESMIVKVIRRASAEKDGRQWVLLIPVYHLTFGIDLSTKETDDKSPKWWGTLGFDGDVQCLKVHSRHRYVLNR